MTLPGDRAERTRRGRRLRRGAKALVALSLGFVSCRAPVEKREAGPRVWLVETSLTRVREAKGDSSGIAERSIHVRGPTLVEYLGQGRVRALDDRFEGQLPADVIETPQRGHGLFLYAQRDVDLHARTQEGAVVGRLRPGAFVAVTPRALEKTNRDVATLVGPSLEFSTPVVVTSSALGVEAKPMARPARTAYAFHGLPYLSWSERCEDLYYDPNVQEMFRFEDGVEQWFPWRGIYDVPTSFVSAFGQHCSVGAVARDAGRLVLSAGESSSNQAPRVVEERDIPADWSRYAAPEHDPTPALIEREKDVYWMRADASSCVHARFRRSKTKVAGDATGMLRADLIFPDHRDDDDRSTYEFPVTFLPALDGAPSQLQWGVLLRDGRPYWKCDCERVLRLVAVQESEMHWLARRLPGDRAVSLVEGAPDAPTRALPLVAYDADPVERWFFDEASCRAALEQVKTALYEDATRSTSLGLHAEHGFGW